MDLELALRVTIFRDTATCTRGGEIGPNISENPAASDFGVKRWGEVLGSTGKGVLWY